MLTKMTGSVALLGFVAIGIAGTSTSVLASSKYDYFKAPGTIGTLSEADSLISTHSPTLSTTVGSLNFIDNFDPIGSSRGHFGSDALFPGVLPVVGESSGEYYAVRITGQLVIPTTGLYTFGSTGDDGARLSIDGTELFSYRIPADEPLVVRSLAAGTHPFEVVYVAEIYADFLELYAAPGNRTTFDSSFRIIGDQASGGLVTIIPEPVSLSMIMLVAAMGVRRPKH